MKDELLLVYIDQLLEFVNEDRPVHALVSIELALLNWKANVQGKLDER